MISFQNGKHKFTNFQVSIEKELSIYYHDFPIVSKSFNDR